MDSCGRIGKLNGRHLFGDEYTNVSGTFFHVGLGSLVVTFVGIATTTSAVFLVGTAIAGIGFGPAFLGAFRLITAQAEPDDRAGLLAAIFIVAYLAFSIPALLAGLATTKYGLHSTALVYSASLAVLIAIAIVVLVMRPARSRPASHAVMPPGPCTCPPCAEALDPA